MALLDIRQRSGYLFLAVVVAHVLLISAQVNSKSSGIPILESVTFGLFAEVQRAVTGGVSGLRQGWSGYVNLREVRAENESLKRELADARVAIQEQQALVARARGLERLLELRDHSDLQTTAANVIGAAATPDFRTITIDKGSRDGLRADMAVIAPAGVVGRVVVPSGRAAKVQLLIDRNAAAGAIIQRSRAQGVVAGAGDERLLLENVSEASDVQTGDAVVTSGIEGIYPKGFVIGHVESIEKNGPAYKRITVRPAVDFSALEDVLIVVTPTPAREAAESGRDDKDKPSRPSPGRAGGND
ncbi:MAG TPA: rod shape-determining protein MreC [Vicinamibacterales bacterium]|nr:rod shape-determining protein MreC [Vicinamibacterales bacterium]